MNLSELDPDHNQIEGEVTKDGNSIFTISGQVGKEVILTRCSDHSTTKIFVKDVCPEADVIHYPPVNHPFQLYITVSALRSSGNGFIGPLAVDIGCDYHE